MRAMPTRRALPLLGLFLLALLLRATSTSAQCTKTPPGERCAGAPGFPPIPWKGGCCAGDCAEDAAKGWGSWCLAAGAPAPEPLLDGRCAKTSSGERCSGADGFPYVQWKGGCCAGECVEDAAKGWGKWCPSAAGSSATTLPQAPASAPVTASASTTTAALALVPAITSVSGGAVTGSGAVAGGSGDNFYGLTYSPFGLGGATQTCPPYSNEGGSFCLGAAQIARDLAFIGSVTRRIRTYAITPCEAAVRQILAYASANGMKVQLGVWLGNVESEDDAEFATLPGLLKDYADVVSELLISNEFLFMYVSIPLLSLFLHCIHVLALLPTLPDMTSLVLSSVFY
jgi:hypothetical protein